MRFGINMYGVAKEFHHDPESFLKEISSFGYRRIEPCISFESQIDLRGNGSGVLLIWPAIYPFCVHMILISGRLMSLPLI